MKSIQSITAQLMIALFFTSCSSTKDVVSNNFIQKRKYTKGFYVKKKTKINNVKNKEADWKTIPIQNLRKRKASISIEVNKSNKEDERKKQLLIASTDNEKLTFNYHTDSTSDNHLKQSSRKRTNISLTPTDKIHSQNSINIKLNTEPDGIKDERPETNTLALVSFILAVSMLPLNFLALPFGAFALRQFKRSPGKYDHKWMANTGVIIGYIIAAIGIALGMGSAIVGGYFWIIGAALGLLSLINVILSTAVILSE